MEAAQRKRGFLSFAPTYKPAKPDDRQLSFELMEDQEEVTA